MSAHQLIHPVLSVLLLLSLLFSPPAQGAISDKNRTMLQDVAIYSAVERALEKDEALSSHFIDVKSREGVITLSGSVDNILSRERAEKIAESIRGVRAVINRLTVQTVERPDTELLSDVRSALAVDPLAEEDELHVTVHDGKVTLTGTVQSWTEKQLIARIVKGVRGVGDLENNIVIKYTIARSDEEIREDIVSRLSADVYVDEQFIDVTVSNNAVTLTGSVGSVAERSYAYADAWVSGALSVDVSALRVDPQRNESMRRRDKYAAQSKEQIIKDIRKAFSYDPRVSPFDISVDIRDGVVILTGTVESLRASKAAEEDALNTAGVRVVKNHIRVRLRPLPPEKDLARTIRETLERDPYITPEHIRFAIKNYRIYLYGSVQTEYERDRIEDIITNIPGVIATDNHISVSSAAESRNIDEVRTTIEEDLFWDSFVNSVSITVSVEDGIVVLSGTVSSRQESDAAVQHALKSGAPFVVNRLKIKEQ